MFAPTRLMLFGSQAEVQVWIGLAQGSSGVIGRAHGARLESVNNARQTRPNLSGQVQSRAGLTFQSQLAKLKFAAVNNLWSTALQLQRPICFPGHQRVAESMIIIMMFK